MCRRTGHIELDRTVESIIVGNRHRTDLQRMLEYIATHQVTYCIVHKIVRLARNRLDDVEIHPDSSKPE